MTQLKASTGVTLNTFTVGKQPGGVAFNGASTWVTNFGGTAVSKLETEKCRNALLLRSSSLVVLFISIAIFQWLLVHRYGFGCSFK